MRRALTLASLAAPLLALSTLGAFAQGDRAIGRTGLPTVKVGGEKVWVDRGIATLNVVGDNMTTSQEYQLHYPGPPAEKMPQRIQVGIRDDYYRAKDPGHPQVTVADARGLTSLSVYIDGRRVPTMTDKWIVNDKKDTATRWHTWWVNFRPGQRHTMRIVTEAPLAIQDGAPSVQFVSKDLGHWRDKPDYVEIRLTGPRSILANLLALQPKPEAWGRNGVRWVYSNKQPPRDVLVMLPATYGRGMAHRTY